MLNSTLLRSAQRIMTNTSPAQFIITAKFISSSEGSNFAFYPFFIDKLTINKDYLENIGDEIDLQMTISPKDYALLQDQGQNLLCVLTITYVNKFGKVVYNPAPIQKQYNVLINSPLDVRKIVPDIQVYTEPSTPISVRLVEPTFYKLRHNRINTVYQNVNLTQVIHAITKSLGIQKIQMVPLDNTHVYDHVDIGSLQGVDSIYGYLHDRFGLYQKGANSYIAGDVLYIYPPFETNPSYDKTAIFYQVDTGNFTGSSIFHKVENNTVSVVVNSQPESYDLSIHGAENIGTGFTFSRSSRMTDGMTGIDSKNGAMFTEEPALTVSLANSRTAVKGLNNVFHIKSTDNPFPAMSQIISHQASLMRMVWMHADPFQIDPGHAVTYYYDQNEVMLKKTGIVEHATFEISRMQKMGTKDMFGAVGQLTLRLSPNETVVI